MTDDSLDEILTANDTWGDVPPFVPSDRKAESRSASQFRMDAARLATSDDPLLERGTLGAYQLHRKIGRGGMGTVYAGFDPLNERPVAIKILHATFINDDVLQRRFQREARLLSEVDSIYVTRLYEIAEADGCCFLVQELVEGQSLAERIKANGPLTESDAIGIVIDVASALVELHQRGIVHRDVKPENILLCQQQPEAACSYHAKLTDLGIARQEAAQESLALTSAQSMLGTPLYMSPEHFYGGTHVSSQSDLYSLGATLFHALTGRPPFQADTALALADAHRHAPPPNPQSINRKLSDGVCEVIRKSMQKRPDLRYASADEFLTDLLHLQRGEATSIALHPLLPKTRSGRLVEFRFSWELESSPEELWPYVSNTERLNRAINLPAMTFTHQRTESGQNRRMAEFRLAGMRMQWQEHMYEWIEGHRMCILREFERGPIHWLTSTVELNRRADGGTTLVHSFKANSRHLPGLLFIKFQLQVITRRALDRVYRRIDRFAGGRLSSESLVDAFEDSVTMNRGAGRRLDQIVDRLLQRRLNPQVVQRLADYVRSASEQDLGRIRPRAIAQSFQLPTESVVDACLYGVHEGLFVLKWDVICPSCRIAAQSQDAIENIRKHVRCEACDFDFEVDFATSVELILQTNPLIRKPDTGQYCIGGPSHSPHVVAQTRVAAGETVRLGLELPEGHYVLRGPQLPFSIHLHVTASAQQQRLFVDLSAGSTQHLAIRLACGQQLITVANPAAKEVLLRIERSFIADDAITAIQAVSLPYFRNLFHDQVVSATQLVGIQELVIVVVAVPDVQRVMNRVSEMRFNTLMKEHLDALVDMASRANGSFVRSLDEGGGILAFRNADSAVESLRLIAATIPEVEGVSVWKPSVSIHQGSVTVTTVNGQLEYMGAVIREARQLAAEGVPGGIVTTSEMVDRLQSEGFEPVEQSDDVSGNSLKPSIRRFRFASGS